MQRIIFFTLFLLFSLKISAQVKDTVLITDQEGEPLSGVNIFTKNYSFTTTTDLNGHFLLPNLKNDPKIHFSFIGFEELRLKQSEIKASNFIVKLRFETTHLTAVEIFGRLDESPDEIPFLTERIDYKEIQLTNASNPADALSNQGLFVQKSQLGGGSPIIRGFEANRVLLVIDGVRMNNAIYRSGHLQNSISPDAAAMQQIEVIFGPGSLIYGSDALGGVVHFRLKDPSLSQLGDKPSFSTGFMTRYSTAANEKTANLNVNFSSQKWASFSNISFSDFGDLRSGSRRPEAFPDFGKRLEYYDDEGNIVQNDNVNIQRQSGYTQLNILQKIRFQPNDNMYFIANLMGSFSSDIPRYDRLTERKNDELKFKKWYYGPQNHLLASLKLRLLQNTSIYDAATFIAAWQNIDEDRFDQTATSDWLSSSFVDVQVFSMTADFEKAIHKSKNHKINYGLDLNHNDIQSHAFLENEDGSIDNNTNSRYPNEGSQYSSSGVYATYKYQNEAKSFHFDTGLRYSYTRLFAKFGAGSPIDWPQIYLDGIESQNKALTWASGFNYQSKNQWKFRFLTATAFRSPNIDDFAKIREKNGFVTVPNPELIPEKTFTIEATLGKVFTFSSSKQMSISATAFGTRLKNAVVRQNFHLPNGDTFFVSNGDTLHVQANVNSTKAFISGFSANIQIDWTSKWQFKSSLNYVQGQRQFQEKDADGILIIDELVAQDHIPPAYGKTSLTYTKGSWKISAVAHYNAAKNIEDYAISSFDTDASGNLIPNREGTADNLEESPIDVKTGEYTGVYAWTTFNLYTSFEINPKWTINFAVENITDLHYRRFASGISGAGRNFVVALRGRFGG